jgi:glyoxylase-like metal-dependent hydrolase (beta-lactamase superfamily II)
LPAILEAILAAFAPTTIVNVGYRSTNYWVVSTGTQRLLVDLGYPDTMGAMRANLRRMGVPLNEIRYGLATHYHMDHAGLAQELKLAGVALPGPHPARQRDHCPGPEPRPARGNGD